MTPHSRIDHFFEFKVGKVDFSKSIRSDQEIYEPRMI